MESAVATPPGYGAPGRDAGGAGAGGGLGGRAGGEPLPCCRAVGGPGAALRPAVRRPGVLGDEGSAAVPAGPAGRHSAHRGRSSELTKLELHEAPGAELLWLGWLEFERVGGET